MRALLVAAALVAAGQALAQPPGPGEHAACEQAREASKGGDAVMQATYANCLVLRDLHEPDALAHARELARASMKQGSELGAFALYAAYTADPAFNFMKDGKPDLAKYNALAALPVDARSEQVEALEALAFAYAKGYPKAMLSLAAYYYETVAPENVARLRKLADQMNARGVHAPYIAQFRKQAAQVAALGTTKASVRAFFDAEKVAALTAQAGLKKQGHPCGQVRLAGVESGEIKDPALLPLKAPALRDTYLVKGDWDETWRFAGCGSETRVAVHFAADGWGGAHFQSQLAAAKP